MWHARIDPPPHLLGAGYPRVRQFYFAVVGTFVIPPFGVVTGIVDGPPDFMFFWFRSLAPLPSALPLPLVPAPAPAPAPPAAPPLAPPAPPAPESPDAAKAAVLSAKANAKADIVTIFFICLSYCFAPFLRLPKTMGSANS